MDSLTQIALGAAVAEATLGKKLGNKAIIMGAFFGTLPDLDVLIRYSDPVANFTFHRGFSHSAIVLTLLTPIIVYLLRKIDLKKWFENISNLKLGLSIWLILITHILLDAMTVYGTQLLWPYDYPFGVSSLFIIDPLYTLPLLISLIIAMFLNRENKLRSTINKFGLIISSLYIIWSIGAKIHVDGIIKKSLNKQGIEYSKILSVPMPLNTLLWRFVVMGQEGYFEGYYSILDKSKDVKLVHHKSDKSIIDNLKQDNWAAARLEYFTHGFYSVKIINNEVIITDLRMGSGDNYVFAFVVGKIDEDNNIKTIPTKTFETDRDMSKLSVFWDRIFDEGVNLH